MRAAVRRGGADDAGLDVVTADLTTDEGWAAAVDACAEVHHVASPMIQAEHPDVVERLRKLQRDKAVAPVERREAIQKEIDGVSKDISDLDTVIQRLMNEARSTR